MDNDPSTTGRIRTVVRVLDVLSEDLIGGTDAEQGVAKLLSHVAAVIVNGHVVHAYWDIDGIATLRPRADRVAQAQEAALAAADAVDLLESGAA